QATAWFDPLPPGAREKEPRVVSPGTGKQSLTKTRSCTKLPTTTTRGFIGGDARRMTGQNKKRAGARRSSPGACHWSKFARRREVCLYFAGMKGSAETTS